MHIVFGNCYVVSNANFLSVRHVYIILFFIFQCRNIYWVEPNYQHLCYMPKRIHSGTTTYIMRLNLALMDWVSNDVFDDSRT